MIGLMVDLHGTLLESNLAWARALEFYDPSGRRYYREQIELKRSRHELADVAGVPFEDLIETYRGYLTPRQEITNIVNLLSKTYPLVLVSNGRRSRVLKDLSYAPKLPFLKVYSIEDGRKSDPQYLQGILDEQKWDSAILIGNDFKEDYSKHPKIKSTIFPQSRIT